MQIYVPHEYPLDIAHALDDARVCVQVKEAAQMFSTALRLAGVDDPQLNEVISPKHPCTLWVSARAENAAWLYELARACEHVRQRRTGGRPEHKSMTVLRRCMFYATERLPPGERTMFPNCASRLDRGIDFRLTGPVTLPALTRAYRLYLRSRWATDVKPPRWTSTQPPAWKDLRE